MAHSSSRIGPLDSLRGLAALTVVMSHVWETVRNYSSIDTLTYWPITIHTLFDLNFLLTYSPLQILVAGTPAVMLFFVLSGFALSIGWQKGNAPSYKDFVIRRFCRIYLPFGAAIIGALFLAVVIQTSHLESSIYLRFWQNALSPGLIIQHLALVLSDNLVLDPPAWSLVYEMRISLLFPILVYFYIQYGLKLSMIFSAVLYLATWISLRLAISLTGQESDTFLTSMLMTLHYIPFFIFGIALASLYYEGKFGRERIGFKSASFLWVAAIIFLFPIWYKFSAMVAHLMWGIGGALLIVLSLDSSRAKIFLANRPVVWLGRVSYSLYLIHMPVLYFCLTYLYGWVPRSITYLIALILIAAISEASYRWIEAPAIRLGRQLSKPTARQLLT